MKPLKILICLLFSVSFFANATDVPIREGMSFLKARKALIKDGWKPNPTYSGEPGVEKIYIRKGFIEFESCTVGIQYCDLNYKKNEICLGVATIGEEVKDMKIYSWNFECPEPEQEHQDSE